MLSTVSMRTKLIPMLFCAVASAQESLSTLRGTVNDASGAVVAGAQLTVI